MSRLSQAERNAITEARQNPTPEPEPAGDVQDTPNEAYPQGRIDAEFARHQRNRLVIDLVKVLGPAMIASASPATVTGLFSNDPDDVKRIIGQTFRVANAYADKFEEYLK